MANVYDIHPQLLHYTDLRGLMGILETNTIWATYYKSLTDFSEIEHMRTELEGRVSKMFEMALAEKIAANEARRIYVENQGGIEKVSRRAAKGLIQSYYVTSFGSSSNGKPAFGEPYIASFCAHTTDEEYAKSDGLLSQWRGYGNPGGFALVFDTKRLLDCLEAESKTYGFISSPFLGDVLYDNDPPGKIAEEFCDLFKDLENQVNGIVAEGLDSLGASTPSYRPFYEAVTRFKHQGFYEEHEVRIVAMPIDERLREKAKRIGVEGEKILQTKEKPICFRERNGSIVPFIKLNDVPGRQELPIIQIIVGPQRDQEARAEEIRRLVGKRPIEVVRSRTPFIPS